MPVDSQPLSEYSGPMNIFRRPAVPASESMVVTLHKMDVTELRRLAPRWVHLYGKTSPQVARINALIVQREAA